MDALADAADAAVAVALDELARALAELDADATVHAGDAATRVRAAQRDLAAARAWRAALERR